MCEITLIDAGFSSQLEKHVTEEINGHPMWTARFLVTSKDKCVKVHRDFIRAGSQIIRTNTYQASVDGFVKHLSMPPNQALSAIRESVDLVREAIKLEMHGGNDANISIAGSIGPYGAYLNNGSEYTGEYPDDITPQALMKWHKPRIQALAEAGVKIMAIETIPCSMEAVAVLELLKEFPDLKAWVSFSAKESCLISNGESITEAASKCLETNSAQLIALGVNCLSPVLVSSFIMKLRNFNSDLQIIVYPNSGETYDTTNARWTSDGQEHSVATYVEEWLNLGASYIGGCCRTTDEDIVAIAREISLWENKIL